jgi:hypothetical protein
MTKPDFSMAHPSSLASPRFMDRESLSENGSDWSALYGSVWRKRGGGASIPKGFSGKEAGKRGSSVGERRGTSGGDRLHGVARANNPASFF